MRSARFVCLFVILSSTMLAAQSNTVALINQPATNNASNGLPNPDPKTQAKILESYGKLPLSFEANLGQTDARVKFLSRSSGYTLFLTGDEAVFSLRGSKVDGEALPASPKLQPKVVPVANAVLRMKLLKANPAARVIGADELPAKSNYFIGNDPKKWRNNVPEYAKVKYEGIYSGIDLVYYGNQRQLEYDFVVAPGADPHRIQFDVRGTKHISRDEHGDLVLQTAAGEVHWRNPIVYQEKDGTRQEIAAHYVIKHKNRIGFEVADYDSERPLFIDPLVYSTYLGGSGEDNGYGIAVDSTGNAYVTGTTESTNFPTMNPLQPKYGGNFDAFVAKLNPSGSALVYSTYLGGGGYDVGFGIAVDSSGNAYVTGVTNSTDFPTMNPLQPAYGGGDTDAFVAQLNATGSALVYSTYLGGSGGDYGFGIAVDSSGNAYVTGETSSTDFPTMSPLQPAYGGGDTDAFVAQLNPAGSALVYSTYLGGSVTDYGQSIAVDSSGDAYVTGLTTSTNFPTMNPLQASNGGGNGDAFVAQIDPSGSALVYSTYLGGSDSDVGLGIAVDSSGNAYVTGFTDSTNFPTTPGAFQTACNSCNPNTGTGDAFVTALNPTGSTLVYSTFLGGGGNDKRAIVVGPGTQGYGVAVDSLGNAYVTGYTTSTNFPTVNPLQPAYGGDYDAFVTKLNPTGSALIYSTYLGGSGTDYGHAIAVDSSGNAYVTGYTSSTNFPTMNPLQPTYGGGTNDAFVAKIAKPSPTVTLVPPNLNFGNQTVGITSAPQKSTLNNTGDGPLTITSIAVTGPNSGDFAEKDNCGTSVPPFGSCDISVTFTPAATGTRNAAVSITDNAPNSPQSLPLTGVGVLPAVTLSPTSLNFGNQGVGTTSHPQVTTLTNTGAGVLTITSIGINGTNRGDFAQTNNCPGSVPTNGTCQISVTFTPKATGSRNAAVSVADNAPGSPQSVPLTGVGTPPGVTFSPTSLTFPDQVIFTTSPTQQVTLTNSGAGVLKINHIGVASPFQQTNNCPSSLGPRANCTITVKFHPTTKGVFHGTVSVTDNAPGSPQKVRLTGTGTFVQLLPTKLNFGTQPVGTRSLAKKVTLTNKGGTTVDISGIAITGTDAGDFAETNTCGQSVASGASCFIKVTFKPLVRGKRTADVSVYDNGGGSPQEVGLIGSGT
jgi:Beta-propeller repeat/Abnormal spindle-like microcephaly-assoc'd, ASPM-SPD-2-Hydin